MRRSDWETVCLILALALAIPACGSRDKAPAPSVATPWGAAARDGKPKDGAATSAEPTQPPEGSEEGKQAQKQPAAPLTPISLKEALAVIDLRTFPVMEGAERVTQSPLGSHFSIPQGDVSKAVEFYRAKLGEAGWKPAADPKLWQIYGTEGAQLIFVKQSCMLYASIGISRGDGNMNAGLFHLGNLDSRRLPRFAGADVTTAGPEQTVYLAAAEPDAVKEFLRAELKKQGWAEFANPSLPGVPRHLTTNERALYFFNRASAIDYSITPANDKTQVSAGVRMLLVQLPIMPGAEGIELGANPLILLYRTSAEPEQVLDFYRQEFAALGYTPRSGGGQIDDGQAKLDFDASEQEPLRLEVLKDQKGTFVQITPSPKKAE